MSDEALKKTISEEVASLLRQHRMQRIISDDLEISIDAIDEQGNTALHLICMPKVLYSNSNTEQTFSVLLSMKPSVHVRNAWGWSPLMLAVLLMPASTVALLLEHDKTQGHAQGLDSAQAYADALLVAASYGRPDCVALLMKAGASRKARSSGQRT